MTIREFKTEDAVAVSELIAENLKTVNIRDYPEELIDALIAHKGPQQLLELAEKCDALVAVEGGRILGIAMLYNGKITNMFVHTQMHGRHIGSSLLNYLEELARDRQVPDLVVDSSTTAVGFYVKRGYRIIRKVNKPFYGIKNTVFEMTKKL